MFSANAQAVAVGAADLIAIFLGIRSSTGLAAKQCC